MENARGDGVKPPSPAGGLAPDDGVALAILVARARASDVAYGCCQLYEASKMWDTRAR